MWDESTIVLGPGAEVVLNAGADLANGSPSITMLTGTSSLAVQPREEDQSVFTVYTPSAVLSVLGTEFDVGIADTGAVKIGVEEGIVEVTDQEGLKAVELTQGKQIVVSLDGKATKAKTYNPEKEDWNKWYEAETKAAAIKVDTLTTAAVQRLDDLKKKIKELEEGIAKMEAKSNELAKKAEQAAAKNDTKTYTVEVKPLIETMTEAELAVRRDRKLNALLSANAYLLRRLNALVRAGVIKPEEAKRKRMEAAIQGVDSWVDDFQIQRIRRRRHKRIRRNRWRRWYLRHHPRGRRYAVRTKRVLPKFYREFKGPKYQIPKRFKPRYLPGVKWRPRRRFKGKKRTLKTRFRRQPNWYKARATIRKKMLQENKRHAKRMERLRRRMRKMRRRRVRVRRFKKPILNIRRVRPGRPPVRPGRLPVHPGTLPNGTLRPRLKTPRPMVRSRNVAPIGKPQRIRRRRGRVRRRRRKAPM